MKKIILFFLLSNCILFADWRDDWAVALEKLYEKNYIESENYFNLAVENMEKLGEIRVQLYIDRGRFYLETHRDIESLNDLDKAMSIKNITRKELAHAAFSRSTARFRLGMEKEGFEDFKIFEENYDDKPITEETEDKIIIRNNPDCDCFREKMKKFYIDAGICESENDIKILDSQTWIIKKKNKCRFGACSSLDREDLSDRASKRGDIEYCNAWCDRAAAGGHVWCTHAFSKIGCQFACALAVTELLRQCRYCCSDGTFYETCGKYFWDIASAMGSAIQNGCKPFEDQP